MKRLHRWPISQNPAWPAIDRAAVHWNIIVEQSILEFGIRPTAGYSGRMHHEGQTSSLEAASSQRVYQGLMRDLEDGRMVPGQRLVETELAARFQVGRNAVREAMQQLAARGVVDLARNRSPSIRRLDSAETLEVLDVAEALTSLVVRTAARRFDRERHESQIDHALDVLAQAQRLDEPGMFSRARRHFYRTLLSIGDNRELRRLFPAIGMHIVYAQYQTPQLRGIRGEDYRTIARAVSAGDERQAVAASQQHIESVRRIVENSGS